MSTSTASNQPPRRDPRNGRVRYVKLWITEMRGRIATLSPLARGAYFTLLLEALHQQKTLTFLTKKDEKFLRLITGISPQKWSSVFSELLGVCDLADGKFVDEYAERCLREFQEASNRNSANIGRRYAVIVGLKDSQS